MCNYCHFDCSNFQEAGCCGTKCGEIFLKKAWRVNWCKLFICICQTIRWPEKLRRYPQTKDNLVEPDLVIIQHKSASSSISQHQSAFQSASISTNQHQTASISTWMSINQHQSTSIGINRYKYESISINQHQLAAVALSCIYQEEKQELQNLEAALVEQMLTGTDWCFNCRWLLLTDAYWCLLLLREGWP